MAAKSVIAVGALLATPVVFRAVETSVAKSLNPKIPKNADVYPSALNMFLGQSTNTTIAGTAVGALTFVVSAVVLRKAVFGPMHRAGAREVLVDPVTGFQKRITNLSHFGQSLAPGLSSFCFNVAVAAVPAAVAKAYVEGAGRFENWDPRPYDEALKAAQIERITHFPAGRGGDSHGHH